MEKTQRIEDIFNGGILINYGNLISIVEKYTSPRIKNTERYNVFLSILEHIKGLNKEDIEVSYFPILESTRNRIKNMYRRYSVDKPLKDMDEFDKIVKELEEIEYIYGKFSIKNETIKKEPNTGNQNSKLIDIFEDLKTDVYFFGNEIIQSSRDDIGFTKDNYSCFYKLQEDMVEIIDKLHDIIYDEAIQENKIELLKKSSTIMKMANSMLSKPNNTNFFEKNLNLIYDRMNELDKLLSKINSQNFNKIK